MPLGFRPRLRKASEEIRRSLWALPTALGLVGVTLGFLLPELDRVVDPIGRLAVGKVAFVGELSADGARASLSMAAGALATILGVTFSIAIVTVQLAATQYTSRLLGRFLRDRLMQVMLGAYIGTVAYLLLVVRTVGADVADGFVPTTSFLAGLLFTLGCLGLLAVFGHHLTRSVQAAYLIEVVRKDTLAALDRVERLAEGAALPPSPPELPGDAVTSPRAGYLQRLEFPELTRCVPAGSRQIVVHTRIGEWVLPGQPLATVWPRGSTPEELGSIAGAFQLGRERASRFDVLFGVRRLVDIALRALSPGVNDVTTAVMAVHALGAVVQAAAQREVTRRGPAMARRCGGAVVTCPALPLDVVLEASFGEIAAAAAGHRRVLTRILELLATIGRLVPESREAVRVAGERVHEAAALPSLAPRDRVRVEAAFRRLLGVAGEPGPRRPDALH